MTGIWLVGGCRRDTGDDAEKMVMRKDEIHKTRRSHVLPGTRIRQARLLDDRTLLRNEEFAWRHILRED